MTEIWNRVNTVMPGATKVDDILMITSPVFKYFYKKLEK
jgi:hypothetical protein